MIMKDASHRHGATRLRYHVGRVAAPSCPPLTFPLSSTLPESPRSQAINEDVHPQRQELLEEEMKDVLPQGSMIKK